MSSRTYQRGVTYPAPGSRPLRPETAYLVDSIVAAASKRAEAIKDRRKRTDDQIEEGAR